MYACCMLHVATKKKSYLFKIENKGPEFISVKLNPENK